MTQTRIELDFWINEMKNIAKTIAMSDKLLQFQNKKIHSSDINNYVVPNRLSELFVWAEFGSGNCLKEFYGKLSNVYDYWLSNTKDVNTLDNFAEELEKINFFGIARVCPEYLK